MANFTKLVALAAIPGHALDDQGLWTRSGYADLTPFRKEAICNGVGADDGLSRLAPDTIWLRSIKESADRHDYDYFCGGNETDRYWDDVAFYVNMYRELSRGWRCLLPLRLRRARAYYLAVRIGGARHFNYLQEVQDV